MAEPAQRLMTLTEFLDWDDGTDTRYELVNGVPIAMAPAAPVHNAIAGNIGRLFGSALPPSCLAMPQAGIARDDAQNAFLIADVAVSCTPIRPGQRSTPDPVVIVEVLSPTTADYDRGTRLEIYRGLPSVQEILLIFSEARSATLWRRVEQGWLVQDMIGDAMIRLDSIGVELPLSAAYANIEF
jgi:Uma2 family endonuclease